MRRVFDSVADRYDLMNDLMSGGAHRLWKHFTLTLTGLRSGGRAYGCRRGHPATWPKDWHGRSVPTGIVILNRHQWRDAAARPRAGSPIGPGSAMCVMYRLDAEQLPFAGWQLRLRDDRFRGCAMSPTSRRRSPRCFACCAPAASCWCSNSPHRAPICSVGCTDLLFLRRIARGSAAWWPEMRTAIVTLAESIRRHPDQADIARHDERCGVRQQSLSQSHGWHRRPARGYRH